MGSADRDEIRAAVAARYAGLARAARAGQAISDGDPDGECNAPGYPDTEHAQARGVADAPGVTFATMTAQATIRSRTP